MFVHTLRMEHIRVMAYSIPFPTVEYLIDERPLWEHLGLAARHSGILRCRFEGNAPSAFADAKRQFLGTSPPFNQFRSPRLTLYGCECGADYCGVLSTTLEVGTTHVRWRSIAFDNGRELTHPLMDWDDDDQPIGPAVGLALPSLAFERSRYFAAIRAIEPLKLDHQGVPPRKRRGRR
jgi:hypothetical protein